MLVFRNPGPLDIRAIKTFGLSAKNSPNAIGYFGTGMKYAIAIFIRNGYEVSLVTGGNLYVFAKSTVDSRGKDFDIITMNGDELPFTTHLGANWELWQAFRELYCNAIDEGGSCEWNSSVNIDDTYFMVNGPEAEKLYQMKDLIVLNCNFVEETEIANINPEVTNWVYYRGIRIFHNQRPYRNLYNIKNEVTLTEDRTSKNYLDLHYKIAQSLSGSKNKEIIKNGICSGNIFNEHAMTFSCLTYYPEIISEEFKQVVAECFASNDDDLNPAVRKWFVEMNKLNTIKNIVNATLSDHENQMLAKAKKIVNQFCSTDGYEFIFSETLGNSTMGYTHRAKHDDRIFISMECFKKGQLFLTSTILEEVVHRKTEMVDETRELQTYLFDELTKQIAKSVGEII